MSEIDQRALIAHEERQFRRRQDAIDAAVIPSTQGRGYEPTVEKRLEWARGSFERFDYLQVIEQAGRILAMSATAGQHDEAKRLRGRAERAHARFGDALVRPEPVEPTWR